VKRLALVVAFLAGCRARASGEAESAAQAAVVAQTAVASEQPFARVVRAIGTVAPRPGRFAELAAPGPTRVARIVVVPGQRVALGDTLVEFERAPFDAAAQSAATALEAAQHNYTRAVRLVQEGILPQKEADQTAADLAQAQVAAVTAHRAQQLAIMRAPLAGVVTRMTAVLGASVDASQPLVQIADPEALDVVFNVSPAEAAEIRPGDSVAVTAVAHARSVQVGGRAEAVVEIVSGLKAGELVVTSGAYGVADGARIVRASSSPAP
jgi:multidrug efflux pump subunit AcrA (membrane-fusion protein)